MSYKRHKWEYLGDLKKQGYIYKRIRVWCRHCGALAEATDFYLVDKKTIRFPTSSRPCGSKGEPKKSYECGCQYEPISAMSGKDW